MISIKNLRKEFDGNVVALDDFNLEIGDKQFVALLGPSGCGKSTTLNCLAGLLDPTAGTILFDGKDVTKAAPKDRNIGMVFQSYALYPHLKVIDNIAFPLKQKNVPKPERYRKAREVAEKLQIGHLLDRKPDQLSGGQQQRVALCRAIVKEPHILLLDEPMSNLDARLKIEIREVIKQLQQDLEVTCIIVTHDQEEAMALADRIAILDGGRIQQFDTPEMLYRHPSNLFVANFMGNPPMNFLDAVVDSCDPSGTVFSVAGKRVPSHVRLERGAMKGKAVTLGVRAHTMHMSLSETDGARIGMQVRIVENLGKELLVYGSVGGKEVRLTTNRTGRMKDLKAIARSRGTIYLEIGDELNVFDPEDGANIAVFDGEGEELS